MLKSKSVGFTPVSNIFIERYMPQARGEFIKIYLLMLKYNISGELGVSSSILASSLNLLESDIMNALHYWNDLGVIKLVPIDKMGNFNVEFLDLVKIGSLHFEEVSFERYPLIQVAIDCFKRKKMYCTILNAANEAAVKLFLEDKIKFFEIGKIVIDTVNDHKYDNFQQGTVEVSKIMTLHNMVYYDIYNQYNK